MSETPDNTGRMPDAMPSHTEHFSSDDLPADASNTPHTHAQNTCSTMANGKNQAGTTETVVDDTLSGKILAGGAESALDLTNERDRGLVRQSLKGRPRRWAGVTDEVKLAVVMGLQKALNAATVHIENGVDVLDAAKVVASVGKTFEALEAQCQKDEHREDDVNRLDSGKLTGAIKLYGVGTPIDAV